MRHREHRARWKAFLSASAGRGGQELAALGLCGAGAHPSSLRHRPMTLGSGCHEARAPLGRPPCPCRSRRFLGAGPGPPHWPAWHAGPQGWLGARWRPTLPSRGPGPQTTAGGHPPSHQSQSQHMSSAWWGWARGTSGGGEDSHPTPHPPVLCSLAAALGGRAAMRGGPLLGQGFRAPLLHRPLSLQTSLTRHRLTNRD